MYAYGAASVKCAVCQTVTPVNPSTMTQPPYQGPSSSAGSGAERAQKPQQTVVIVNPPTLDADGNEVRQHPSDITCAGAHVHIVLSIRLYVLNKSSMVVFEGIRLKLSCISALMTCSCKLWLHNMNNA